MRVDVLAAALRTAGAALARSAGALAAADDPLQLPRASLPGAAVGQVPATALAAYAALYLHSQLDDAGVIATVDALADQRLSLRWLEATTLDRLDRYARNGADTPLQAQRAQLYARLFGFGASSATDRVDFNQRLLRLAVALLRAETLPLRAGPAAMPLSTLLAWRQAALALQALVAVEPEAPLAHWARRIHLRVLAALEILGDAALMRRLGSTTPWATLARLAGDDGGARDAAARRGASGQTLLRGLDRLPPEDPRPGTVPGPDQLQAARRWLAASGLPLPPAASPPTWTGPAPVLVARSAFGAGLAARAPMCGNDALPQDRWPEGVPA